MGNMGGQPAAMRNLRIVVAACLEMVAASVVHAGQLAYRIGSVAFAWCCRRTGVVGVVAGSHSTADFLAASASAQFWGTLLRVAIASVQRF